MTTVRRLARAAVLASAALILAGPAVADPLPPDPSPAPPSPAELLPAIGSVLAQAGGQPAGPLGLPDLSNYGTNLILGQTAQPALPGAPAAAVPSLNAFNPDYMLGQNVVPAAPGQGTLAPGIGPNDDIGGTGRIAFLRRFYAMYQAGGLKGALLGQQSPEEFTAELLPPAG